MRTAMKKTTNPTWKRARQIVRLLKQEYPDAHCALHHHNALELLIATILSAQCTDVQVNKVTPALFACYPDAPTFARARLSDLCRAIQSIGFFRSKASHIIRCCQTLVDEHGG